MNQKKKTIPLVQEDAKLAAAYFRELAEQGVPMQLAAQITGNYVVSLNMYNGEFPGEDWK